MLGLSSESKRELTLLSHTAQRGLLAQLLGDRRMAMEISITSGLELLVRLEKIFRDRMKHFDCKEKHAEFIELIVAQVLGYDLEEIGQCRELLERIRTGGVVTNLELEETLAWLGLVVADRVVLSDPAWAE